MIHFLLQRVAEEEQRRMAREAEIQLLAWEEAELLERLRHSQVPASLLYNSDVPSDSDFVRVSAGFATERVRRAGTGARCLMPASWRANSTRDSNAERQA
jgi:hypothetical protein